MDNMIVFGAGGHADSCKQVMDEFGPWNYVFLKRDELTDLDGWYFIAIGDNRKRHDIYYERPLRRWHSFLSKRAIGFPIKLGIGSIIMPGAIIRPGVEIGDFTIINSGAILDHGVKVGDFCHIAPGAVVCGDGRIGDGTFLGANSTYTQGIKIGPWKFIKANSLVKEDMP